ncbi:MAG: NAD-dependent epimerase/dehydratase family protein [Solirubrobacteraceae bacterium]
MILVTGGAGFIGSHVVDALVAEGHDVRVLDALDPSAHNDFPDYLNPAAEFIHGDIRDPSTVERALNDVTEVCHQASKVGLETSFEDATDYVAHNDVGTTVLLAAMARRAFTGRLVLASSMVVYGEGRYACPEHGVVPAPPRTERALEAGEFEPQCPFCARSLTPQSVPEHAPPDPRNVYAATKLHQEHLCSAFGRHTGVPVTALRYHNVYGPRMPRDTPYAGVASIFRSSLEHRRAPQVFEDGGQLRDFVHVRDVARANLIALTAADRGPAALEAFNIASGTPRSVLQMAQALADAAGPDAPRPELTGAYRLGDVRHVFAAADRARQILGFTATEDFAEGMREFATARLR